MHRLLAIGAAALALGLGTSAAQAGSSEGGEWEVRIVGSAKLDPSYQAGGMYARTGVLIPVKVRCPAGESGYGLDAGFPGYFPSGQMASPTLPSMTAPLTIVCTGRPRLVMVHGRSIARNQDPSTHPFERFSQGRATVVVEVRKNEAGPGAPVVRDQKKVQIVVPGGSH